MHALPSNASGAAPTDKTAQHLANLYIEIETLHGQVVSEGAALLEQWSGWVKRAEFKPAALNLACHLALRRRDLRALQEELARFGLSTLEQGEAHIAESLAAMAALLARAASLSPEPAPTQPTRTEFITATRRQAEEATRVFGPPHAKRQTRIMATVPLAVASDPAYAAALIERGIEAVRFNLGTGDLPTWTAAVATFRAAQAELAWGAKARVVIDLAGPRIRTVLFAGMNDRRRFAMGDSFWLVRAPSDCPPHAHCIGCSVPEIVGQLHFDAPVWIADGELGGRVVERQHGAVRIEITHAPEDGKRLKADKGLRFPATELATPALTDEDVAALEALGPHADIIGYSFVQGAEDVLRLHETLQALGLRGAQGPALMVRIETRRALRNLPEIIVAAAGLCPAAIMIAQGDLAVEVGHQRLAEVRHDILGLCEAAGMPVVWAAPILKELSRRGEPSRGEIAEALMGLPAECVLLNKGEHLLAAADLLADVLQRKAGLPAKRIARLRALQAWQSLFVD